MKIENQKYLKNHPAATEYKFLFSCCQAAFASTPIIVQCPKGIRPKVFLEIIQHHKLIPQLYPILKGNCENLPDEILQEVRDLLTQHNLRILKLSGELVRLSKLFDAQQILWLNIKGPSLSMKLYGDIAARQAHDLDILVEERHLDKATDILRQASYIPTYDPTEFNATQVQFWRKYYKDVFFTLPSQNLYVELHWRLISNNSLFSGIDFFKNHQKIAIGNSEIPVPDDMMQILYLCYHGAHHSWRRLFWLWDMAMIIQRATPEQINKMIEQASKYGLTEMLGQTAFLSNLLFGVTMPDGLKELTISPKITKMALRFILHKDIPTLRQIWLNLIYDKRISPKQDMKSLLAVALTNPIHWKTIHLPEKLFFLYYFLRPVAVIVRKIKSKPTSPIAQIENITY